MTQRKSRPPVGLHTAIGTLYISLSRSQRGDIIPYNSPSCVSKAMGFWSSDANGECMLKGVEGDETNPPRLDQSLIATILLTTPKAQEDFAKIFPSLLPAEQARLSTIVANHPWAMSIIRPSGEIDDEVQSVHARAGVRTSMPGGQNV